MNQNNNMWINLFLKVTFRNFSKKNYWAKKFLSLPKGEKEVTLSLEILSGNPTRHLDLYYTTLVVSKQTRYIRARL